MPIKHFDSYLSERKHLNTLPLSTLSDSRLGIDASYYLTSLLTSEPLLAATGGLPLALTQRIETDLRVLEKLRVKPVFVFSGLVPNSSLAQRKNKAGGTGGGWTTDCADRQGAWERYEQGQEEPATRLFAGRAGLVHWDLWRMVLRVFRHRNVEFIVAPYLAWPQLIYLQRHQKAYSHAIFGPTETLLFPGKGGVDRLITSLDLLATQPTFTFITKSAILHDLGVDDTLFLDIGILVGFGPASSTGSSYDQPQMQSFPPTAHEQGLKATVDMVKYYKSGHSTVLAFGEHPPTKAMQYHDHYARTRSMIRFSLIFSSEGTVQPLPLALGGGMTAADIPSDLADIFTHKLPDEIFFYLSRGLLGPQALMWLTSGQIVEHPPLDNGETTEYKRFVKEVVTEGQTGPRATALALISSVTHPWWGKRVVQGWFWFEGEGAGGRGGGKGIMHHSAQTSQLAERVGGWNVGYLIVEEELRRQNSSTIDFALCLGATATDRLAQRTKGSRAQNNPTGQLEKKDEVVANVIWRFLELRGFLMNQHTHSSLARAMHTALKQARVNDKFQDPLYLFLELVRAGVMHGHLWSNRAFSGGPSFGTDDEKTCMLLVMRVLSIVPLNFKPQPWSAPLSRELLVFNSFVRSLTRALRTLLEVTSLNMLLREDCRRARDDYLDITLSLPFQSEVNTGFGVLAKVYLDALTHLNGGRRVVDAGGEGVREAKGVAMEICEETFGGGVRDVRGEVERGFRFWDMCVCAMRQLHAEGSVLRELVDQFEAAEAWLRPMRP